MQRLFSKTEARQVIESHKGFKSAIDRIIKGRDELSQIVIDDICVIRYEEMLKKLSEIPIDDIDTGGKSSRVAALEDHDIKTFADAYDISAQSLAEECGISGYDASNIKGIIDSKADEIKNGIRIRIDAEDMSLNFSKLASDLFLYARISEMAASCEKIRRKYAGIVDLEMEALKIACADVGWKLAPQKEKNNAVSAFDRLTELGCSDTYGNLLSELGRELEKLKTYGPEKARDEIKKDPRLYASLLEDIFPNFVCRDETEMYYGIPDDIAKEAGSCRILTEGLNCELKKYQEWGVKFILHQKNVLLADEISLGKDIQAIAACVSLKNEGKGHFLFVCPAGKVQWWSNAISKLSDLQVYDLHGQNFKEAAEKWLENGGAAVCDIISSENLRFPVGFRLGMLTVDEADNIKDINSARAANIKRLVFVSDSDLFLSDCLTEKDTEQLTMLISVIRPDIAAQISMLGGLPKASAFKKTIAPVFCRRCKEEVDL